MLKSNRSSHLAPLITRLQIWGYDIDAVKPVAKVLEKLDSATLSLMERLVHDLTQLNECSHDLRNQVNTLTSELDHERHLLDRLRGENQRLLRENSELFTQVRTIHRLALAPSSCSLVPLKLRASLPVLSVWLVCDKCTSNLAVIGTYLNLSITLIWMTSFTDQNNPTDTLRTLWNISSNWILCSYLRF